MKTAVVVGVGVGLLVLAAMAGTEDRRWEEGRVMEIEPSEWINKVLAKTSAHEGHPWSMNLNQDGTGLSYGILQWTQRSGNLGKLLQELHRVDAAAFVRIFGAGSVAVAQELLRATGGGVAAVAGANLWSAPWTGRFAEAGRWPAFVDAQYRLAAASEYMQGALAIGEVLGLRTERAISLFFDRCVQQGPQGARGPAERLVEAWRSGQVPRYGDRAGLAQYAWLCASRFRRTTAPASSAFNAAGTIRWVQLAAGAQELDLHIPASGEPALVRRAQAGPTWHAVTGSWDLWDDILKRSADILGDVSLRDVDVGRVG